MLFVIDSTSYDKFTAFWVADLCFEEWWFVLTNTSSQLLNFHIWVEICIICIKLWGMYHWYQVGHVRIKYKKWNFCVRDDYFITDCVFTQLHIWVHFFASDPWNRYSECIGILLGKYRWMFFTFDAQKPLEHILGVKKNIIFRRRKAMIGAYFYVLRRLPLCFVCYLWRLKSRPLVHVRTWTLSSLLNVEWLRCKKTSFPCDIIGLVQDTLLLRGRILFCERWLGLSVWPWGVTVNGHKID